MLAVFKLEVNNVLLKRGLVFIYIAILLLCMYFVHSGVESYKGFNQQKENFLKYEESRVERYVSWAQYGGFGFGVIHDPSPLIVFFNNNIAYSDLSTNIDTLEVINIVSSKKGKSLMVAGDASDFSRIILIFGSLLMIFMGSKNLRSYKFIKRILKFKNLWLSLFFRVGLLLTVFSLIFLICFFFAVFQGVEFPANAVNSFIQFWLFAMVFLFFFYMAGFFVSVLCQKKTIVLVLIVWFTGVFIVPELSKINITDKAKDIPASEELNIEKIGILMDFEKSVREGAFNLIKENKDRQEIQEFYRAKVSKYMEEGYKANQISEKKFLELTAKAVDAHKRNASLFPSVFFGFLAKEISSRGYYSYLDFFFFISELRDKFVNFYIENRYNKLNSPVKPFIKAEENIFKAQSRLPGNYWVGLALTVFYSLVLLMVSLFVIRRRLGRVPVVEERPDLEYLEGISIFMMCKGEEYRDNVFEIFARQENVAGLDRVELNDIDSGIHPRKAVRCLAAIRGVNERTVLDHLRIMGVEEEGLNTSKPSVELLKKIYAALVMAEADIIVINDFLKGETRAFEKDFLNLVAELKKQGKMFVYMSTEIFSATAAAEERYYSVVEVYNYKAVDIENTSLR